MRGRAVSASLAGEAVAPLIRPSLTRGPPSPASGRRSAPGFTDKNEAVRRALTGIDQFGALLLAVSGGPDSMALLHMVAAWANALPAPPTVHVATVDHELRPEAAREAEVVAVAAATLGLPHATLHWRGPKPTSRRQERARAARYALLAAHARTIGATHILTAHHADDQAETVLFRMGRGSGLRGLAGMRRETSLSDGLTLVRPLLDWRKADLVAYCRERNIGYTDDPSNADPAYARARLRAQSAMLKEFGLDTEGLVRLARRMARADAALERETERIEAALSIERVQDERGHDRFHADLAKARDTEAEILLRLLRRAIAHVAPGPGPLKLERLETLTDAVAAALREGRPHRATLGGTRIILAASGTLAVSPEPPRRRH